VSSFTDDLWQARAAARKNAVPVLTIYVVPSGMENFPEVFVAVDDVVTWRPVRADSPVKGVFAGPEELARGLECLEEQLLPEGGPAVLSSYLEAIS
jgi:hypothetical protein